MDAIQYRREAAIRHLTTRALDDKAQVFGNQAAAQLWFRLGLPVVPAMLHDPRQLNLLDYSVVKAAPEGQAAA